MKSTFIHHHLPILLTALTILSVLSGCIGGTETTIPTSSSTNTSFPTITNSPTLSETQTPFVVTATSIPVSGSQNAIVFSMMDNGYAHLFAFSPHGLPLTRLTSDPWDDITPAISPDGSQVAFASRQTGYWDLYLMSLTSGSSSRLTDTMDYESSPSWSPDGQWLVFETYRNGNLDLDLLSVQNPQNRIHLTDDLSADQTPSWSPLGRQIAFISNRSGENEVWVADLDKSGGQQFFNISNNTSASETHPCWSPDGRSLAWAASRIDSSPKGIFTWNNQESAAANWIGSGDWPIWSPDGSHILSLLLEPNQTYIEEFDLRGHLSIPPTLFPGSLRGIDFGYVQFSTPLADPFIKNTNQSPTPLFNISSPLSNNSPGDFLNFVDLPNVQAPYPRLLDILAESFTALRQNFIIDAGWDVLGSLDNAFVPISVPLNPGMSQDWLYTGRAFSLNPILIEAGWLAIVKEEIGQQTYWRVFMRTRAQDGSQGEPLRQNPWDIYARFSGTPMAYDQGGQLISDIPSGFWLDFTALANSYGWERIPSLSNWPSYFTGTRFGEFVSTGGLDWYSAMRQIYSPEVFLTPTAVVLPSRTPTKTPWHYQAPSLTPTSTPRPTLTPRP